MLSWTMVYRGNEPSWVHRPGSGGVRRSRQSRMAKIVSILLTACLIEVAMELAFAAIEKRQCLADGNQWDDARGLCFHYMRAQQPDGPA